MAVSRTQQRSRTSRSISRMAQGRNSDRPLVPSQPYTLVYLRKRFPKASQIQIAAALEDCLDELKTDDRQQVMNCLKQKLREFQGKGVDMATNKMRNPGEGIPIQGRQGGGGQQSGGNKLRGKTGTAGGQKKKKQSREVGRKGGGRG